MNQHNRFFLGPRAQGQIPFLLPNRGSQTIQMLFPVSWSPEGNLFMVEHYLTQTDGSPLPSPLSCLRLLCLPTGTLASLVLFQALFLGLPFSIVVILSVPETSASTGARHILFLHSFWAALQLLCKHLLCQLFLKQSHGARSWDRDPPCVPKEYHSSPSTTAFLYMAHISSQFHISGDPFPYSLFQNSTLPVSKHCRGF